MKASSALITPFLMISHLLVLSKAPLARISGKKGERIVYIRTLIDKKNGTPGRSIDSVRGTGQYL